MKEGQKAEGEVKDGLSLHVISIFEGILSIKCDTQICDVCAKTQTHRAVYCQQCGKQYGYNNPLTLMQRIKSASMIQTKWKSVMVDYRPSYLAAVYFRRYQHVATKEDFIRYVEGRL